MKCSSTLFQNTNRFFAGICLLCSMVVLFSFKVSKKERERNAILSGVWMTGEITNPSTSHMKVFNDDGTFYEIHFENGHAVMSHKGMFKVIDVQHYQETVTNARFNGQYGLKGNIFTNYYELSKDNQRLILRGVVHTKDGLDSLRWSHEYKRVQVPE